MFEDLRAVVAALFLANDAAMLVPSGATVLLILTLIVILGGDGEDRVLDVLVFVNLCFVEGLVEVRWIVILVGNSNTDEFGNCGG